jgi:hypothetical protein
MAELRDRPGPGEAGERAVEGPGPEQGDRALAGLVSDGLLIEYTGSYRLP